MRLSPCIAAFGAFVALTATPAGAAEATKEISTAAVHAGMAAGSDNLKMVQTHLQHVINCLEGPAGANFNAGPGNPCKDFGAGAIPELRAGSAQATRDGGRNGESGTGRGRSRQSQGHGEGNPGWPEQMTDAVQAGERRPAGAASAASPAN